MMKWRNKTRKNAGLRGLVIRIHGIACYVCGNECLIEKKDQYHPSYLTIDHVVPKVRGGSDHLENLRPAHARCNMYLNEMMQAKGASDETT